MFTISVCMIVKNESEVIERSLSCAEKFADEIIVVDTGSTDNTKSLAQKHTKKVFDFPWNDDFSAARNYSFSLATCDYQMWLDADDVVTQSNIKKLLKLKTREKDVDVYMCKYSTGFDENNLPKLTYNRERLLKHGKNFLWQGFVHEVIAPSGKIEQTDIEIEHRKMKQGDPTRNLRMYENALKKGKKFNAREQYYYARELYYNNKTTKAVSAFKTFLKMENSYPPDNLNAHIMLSDCELEAGKTEQALKTLIKSLEKHTPNAELCCKIAHIQDLFQNTQSAIFWFKSALNCEKSDEGFVSREHQEFIPCLELSRLLYFIDKESATAYHQRAKSINPNHPSIIFNEQFFS